MSVGIASGSRLFKEGEDGRVLSPALRKQEVETGVQNRRGLRRPVFTAGEQKATTTISAYNSDSFVAQWILEPPIDGVCVGPPRRANAAGSALLNRRCWCSIS
jgi:hypothetical protein